MNIAKRSFIQTIVAFLFGLTVFVLPTHVFAAVAFQDATDLGYTTGTSLTTSYVVTGSNPVLLVGVVGDVTNDLISGVTWNGVALTKIGGSHGSVRWNYLYYLAAPAAGTHNIVITASSSSFIGGTAAVYTDIDQTSPIDVSVTNNGTGVTSLTTSATTTVDNDWLVGADYTTNFIPTAGTGTMIRGSALYPQMFDSNGAINPAGSASLILNTSGFDDIGVVMAAIKPFVGNPDAPSGLQVESRTNPTDLSSSDPGFSAIYESASTTSVAESYQIQVSTDSGSWTSLYWDSGKQTVGGLTGPGDRSPAFHRGAAFSVDGRTYYWRIKFWDQADQAGDWSTDTDYFKLSPIAFHDSTDLGKTTGKKKSYTQSYTLSGSNPVLLVAVVGDVTSDVISGVTWNGVALTKVGGSHGSVRWNYLYYLAAPASGTHNIVITASSPSVIGGTAAVYTGVDQTSPIDVSVTNNGTGVTSLTTSATTTVDNDWLVGADYTTNFIPTAGTGTTIRGSATYPQIFDSTGSISPAGSAGLILNTSGSDNIGVVVAAIKPVTSIAFSDSTDLGYTTATSFTQSYTLSGSNPVLLVGVVGDVTNDLISGVTWNGVALTKVGGSHGSVRWNYLYYLAAPASGTHNIVISASTSSFIAGTAVVYTGVAQSNPIDTSGTNSGSSVTSLTNSLTTSTDRDWLVLSNYTTNYLPTIDSGATIRGSGTHPMMIDSNGGISPAGFASIVLNTYSADNYGVVMAAIKPL